MAADHFQDSQRTPATAKLARVPKGHMRGSRTSGRNMFSWLRPTWDNAHHFSFPSNSESIDSHSQNCDRSHDFQTTVADDRKAETLSGNTNSKLSFSQVNPFEKAGPSPLPRKTSLMKNSDGETVASNGFIVSRPSSGSAVHFEDEISVPKTKTTVVVHMSKNSSDSVESPTSQLPRHRINSIPASQKHIKILNQRYNPHQASQSISSDNNISLQDLRVHHRLNQKADNPFLIRETSRNLLHRNNHMIGTSTSWNINHRSFEDVHKGIPFEKPLAREFASNISGLKEKSGSVRTLNSSKFDRKYSSEENINRTINGDVRKTKNTTEKQQNDLPLNSLQVFRQSKYKKRAKAERKIRQLQHLEQSTSCNEVVHELGQTLNQNFYENQNFLNIFQEECKSGFITTSKTPVFINEISQMPKSLQSREQFLSDHVYAEIDDRNFSMVTPVIRKRVTFCTNHEPFTENDFFPMRKKIFPVTFWGIVEVKCALREKRDNERRGVAKLCYHAIRTSAANNSLKILGRVDKSRCGEATSVVIEESSFEILDEQGLIIAKHRPTDISVVTETKDDPNLFIYIGRCEYSGRIGIVLRFNKLKHLAEVVNFLRISS